MFHRLVRFALLSSAFVVGAAVGCGLVGERIEGSGKAATEDRPVGEVTDVTLSGFGELKIVQGEKDGLAVTADDNVLPLIETDSGGGKLTLRTKSGYNVRPKTPLVFTLTVKKLERVTVSGAGDASCEGLTAEALDLRLSGAGNLTFRGLDCKSLDVRLSGAGNAKLAGSAPKFHARVSGAGDIAAGDLKTATADIEISGAGNGTVWATDELKARVSGAGDVKYKGTPKVDQKVSGAGSVTALAGR